MDRYICVHGHFYQPPRENPWLEAIELQDSAYPYHDWNQRITAECYAPNGASRILDGQNRIEQIVSNYARISFNFGPTLLAWLEKREPAVYRSIIEADLDSRRRFSGHGSAMAQAYNHMIMPLANRRDKRTQVLWGIRDFESRFKRRPEGMWLPETAADLETLEALAEAGIRFTVLSPAQAGRVGPRSGREWRTLKPGEIDPSMAYEQRLPSGRSIALFFYDGPISRAVAFEKLLERGENLANRLAEAFSDTRHWTQLVHIATDGETYGHHRRHADMALAYALHHIEATRMARLTNYGEFLEKHPPTQDVEIAERRSWSCAHGIERWRANCGCNSGGHPEWNQQWRGPLRDAFDWLRGRLAAEFETRAAALFADPWEARDDYIDVVLDRSPECVQSFFARNARKPLAPREQVVALKLMEMQRHAMLMYTSCGWFFDELSGIETVQVIQYAARALQLAEQLDGSDIESGFLERLSRAKSNLPKLADGRRVYDEYVRPAIVDLEKAGAHYAISSLFEDYGERTPIYCYTVQRENALPLEEGKTRLLLGKAAVSSEITRESEIVTFGVLHLGDHNVYGGVRRFIGEEAFRTMADDTAAAFRRGDLPELIRAVDRNFGGGTFSLRYLFRDEQRRIVTRILDAATEEAATLYRSFYSQYGTLVRFVADLGIPLPPRFQMAVDFTLNDALLSALCADPPDPRKIADVLQQVERAGIPLDRVTLEFHYRRTLESAARAFREDPDNLARIEAFERAAAIVGSLPFEVNLWSVQNTYFEVMRDWAGRRLERTRRGTPESHAWVSAARSLGEKLYVNTDRFFRKAAR